MNARGTIKTFAQALADRGFVAPVGIKGAGLLEWLVDDTGDPLRGPEGRPNVSPAMAVAFDRVAQDSRGAYFKLNNGVALAADRSELLWIG